MRKSKLYLKYYLKNAKKHYYYMKAYGAGRYRLRKILKLIVKIREELICLK